MKREIMNILLLITSLLIIVGLSGIVNADSGNATMTVEVNIIGFANESNASDVSIWVSDYINLGNVTRGDPVSNEVKFYVNNTGKLPITVTPQLKDSEEIIYNYLFFRLLKTSNGTDVPFTKIGDFSMDIDKPTSGSSYKSKYCYMSLDLTNLDGEIKEDLIGYKSDIVFLAMPQ